MHKGRVSVIVRELYGLKGSGSAWELVLIQLIRDLGFTPCRSDGDVWTRKAVDTSNLRAITDVGLPVG